MTARNPAVEKPAIAGERVTTRPFIATIALFSMMLPISFDVGSIHLSTSRTLFLILCPILLIRLLMGKYGRVTQLDVWILLYMLWRSVVPFINNPALALEYVGSNSVIFLGGYLAARASIRSASDFRWFARVLGTFVILTFPFALSESITGNMVLPPLLEKIPGVTSVTDVMYDRRMGLDRAQVVFAHPILYGLFCSMGVAIFFLGTKGHVPTWRRVLGTMLIGGSCFLSVSSGPFLSMVAQFFLLLWAFVLRNVETRWRILGFLTFLAYVVIEIGSNRPGIYAVVSLLSFAPHTANVRLILLEYGLAQVVQTPLFGVGFNNWNLPVWMSGSLDNFWLANALIFGLPAFLLLAAAFAYGMIAVGRRKFAPGGDLYNIKLSWMIVMVSITLTLATVYIWSEIASLVMFVIGSGAFLLHAEDPKPQEVVPGQKAPRGPVYTRFPGTGSGEDNPRFARPAHGTQ